MNEVCAMFFGIRKETISAFDQKARGTGGKSSLVYQLSQSSMNAGHDGEEARRNVQTRSHSG